MNRQLERCAVLAQTNAATKYQIRPLKFTPFSACRVHIIREWTRPPQDWCPTARSENTCSKNRSPMNSVVIASRCKEHRVYLLILRSYRLKSPRPVRSRASRLSPHTRPPLVLADLLVSYLNCYKSVHFGPERAPYI